MTTTSAPVRRTQGERRTATRALIVDAAVECLVTLGYARTTTSEVQQRAGVSRGALTHHFAAKSGLVLAATDQLYASFSTDIRDAAASLPRGRRRVRAAIRLLWQHFDGPLFVAAMELWVAARTDPELRAALLPHERRLAGQLRDLTAEVFGPDVTSHPAAGTVYDILLTSMRGQAMASMIQPGAARDDAPLQAWFDLVEAFAAAPQPTGGRHAGRR